MGASMRRGDLKRESIHGSRKEGRHRPARQASQFARGGCYICRRGERHRGRFVWVKRGAPHDVRNISSFPDRRTELEMLARLGAGLTDGFPGTDPSPEPAPPVQDHRKTFWERVREIFTYAKAVD